MTTKGSLVCVGTGIKLGAHITKSAEAMIRSADQVFCVMADAVSELWVKQMNPNFTSLQKYYQEGKKRKQSYQQMADDICQAVESGKQVCAVFYGHPGIFAGVSHLSIKTLTEKGFPAYMEPGISADSVLYADLGFDPGKHGCQQYEATYFLREKPRFEPKSYLILWQIHLAGDMSFSQFNVQVSDKQVLVDELLKNYPENHQVVLYEASMLPTQEPRIEVVDLQALAQVETKMHTTLVVPPIDR